MEKVKIQELLAKYNAGEAGAQDMKAIETLLENGTIGLEDLEDISNLQKKVFHLESPTPSLELDHRFFEMLREERETRSAFSWKNFSWKNFFSWPQLAPRLAFASVMLLIGVAIGFFLSQPEKDQEQMATLTQQVSDLKEMMMLSLLEKGSATERLKAVSLTQEMDHASLKVTEALLETLNHDGNVNVRLAALDALKPYARDNKVRAELIRSISLQDSPLVQVALAELMAALQEKSSVKELRKILEDERTPKDVRNKIRESIDVLI